MVDWYDDAGDRWAANDDVQSVDLNTETYHKFLLGLLNSRVLHYYLFKRPGEIDAAEAFANMRQGDIRELPVPVAELCNEEGREKAEEIAAYVESMLGDSELGSEDDWRINRLLLELFGLAASELVYINSKMGLGAYHKKMQELYPDGKPPAPERKQSVTLTVEGDGDASQGAAADD